MTRRGQMAAQNLPHGLCSFAMPTDRCEFRTGRTRRRRKPCRTGIQSPSIPMLARDYWKAVIVDRAGLLDRFLAVLRTSRVRFCVIGGQGVNAYAEPVVSLDLDLVLAADAVERIRPVLEKEFHVESFPHSLNISSAGSNLRVQIQLDPRYQSFITRATEREILGERLPVAAMQDVLQGKIWAALDPER